jgi:serine/threonine protein kinase/WD40 repeat protein
MKDCPAKHDWMLFLGDQLPADQEAMLAQHLEECPNCLRVLELLTSSEPRGRLGFPPDKGGHSELEPLRFMIPEFAAACEGQEAPARSTPQIPGYIVERELGRGGMGIVYLARQTQLNRRVALKVILSGEHATPEQIVRFWAEAQMCAALRQDQIVQIFDVGQHAGLPYYAMEFVDGPNLAESARQRPFQPREAAQIVESLARAMHVAHLQGVIHRDLKPGNVLLQASLPGAVPVAKITDFGLARRFDQQQHLTKTLALLGTPDYMAPEQVEPGTYHIGPSVDIYALGAVLYFLVAGRAPFVGSSAMEVLAKVKDVDPESPSQLNRTVPHDLSTICLRCLEKQPNRRYPTALALAEDLGCFLRGEPIAARRVTDWERLQKWSVRNPTISALAISLFSVVLLAVVLVSWQWYRAEQARARESLRADGEVRSRQRVQTLSAEEALDRGVLECRAGKIEAGLQAFDRALALLPGDGAEPEFSIRANREFWREWRCSVEQGCGQGTAVLAVAFAPDGKTLLTANAGNVMGHATPSKVSLWDVSRLGGKPLWTVDHPLKAKSAAFHPAGQLIAVGSTDGTASIRDARTGELQFALTHPEHLSALAFSPTGKYLATGGGNVVRIWSVENAAIDQELKFSWQISCLDWHSSSATLAIGGVEADQPAAGKVAIRKLFGHEPEFELLLQEAVQAVAFQPHSNQFATGSRDGLVRFWQVGSKVPAGRSLPHTRGVNGLKFTADGAWLATASGSDDPRLRAGNGEVRVWNVEQRSLWLTPRFEPLVGNSQNMNAVAFCDGKNELAAVSSNGCAWLWSLPDPVKPRLQFQFSERSDPVFSPDGKRLLLIEQAPRFRGFRNLPVIVRLIDTKDGRCIASLPHPKSVSVQFSQDSQHILVHKHKGTDACADFTYLWDADTGASRPLPAGLGPIANASFLPDSNVLITATAEGSVRQWEATTMRPMTEPLPCFAPDEFVVAFHPQGTRLIVSGDRGTQLISFPQGKSIAKLTKHRVEAASFPDRETALIVANQQLLHFRADDGEPLSAAIPPQDRYLANHGYLLDRVRGGSSENWQVAEGTGDSFPVRGHIALHPSRAYLASTELGVSEQFQLWSLHGKPLGPPLPHALIYAAEFNSSGTELATCSFDGSVCIWAMPALAPHKNDQVQ